MQNNFSSLKETAQTMHRIYVEVYNEKQWRSIMYEARTMFGSNWKTQPRVLRKLKYINHFYLESIKPVEVWFDVPDSKFAIWIAVKLAVRITKTGYK
jgi:hypothetical protein